MPSTFLHSLGQHAKSAAARLSPDTSGPPRFRTYDGPPRFLTLGSGCRLVAGGGPPAIPPPVLYGGLVGRARITATPLRAGSPPAVPPVFTILGVDTLLTRNVATRRSFVSRP